MIVVGHALHWQWAGTRRRRTPPLHGLPPAGRRIYTGTGNSLVVIESARAVEPEPPSADATNDVQVVERSP
jgi:hypothetical protein